MEISFSQSFLDNLERIDNKVVIDKLVIDSGEQKTDFQVINHGKGVQICVEGVSGECRRLDFYYGENLGFTITGDGIVMNQERTIFEFNLPTEPKAKIECPGLTEDIKFLEGPGPELGNSLYKDIPVSDSSLIWKGTIGKYIIDKGVQDNHFYDIELLDTRSGVLEERPIKFKSYQGIKIEQGNWEVETIKKSVVVKHDVYSDIISSSFLVWDSPMSDAKVNLDKEPVCIENFGEYVDPGNIIYGNTDCFQFINYQSSLVGFRITGTVGSKVEVLFNKESVSGGYTSFVGVIGEDRTIEIRFSGLPYLHFNGISAVGPSKVTRIETIMYLEEVVDEYTPNPDKTYVAKVRNEDCVLRVNGVCDYIEYEKYLGEIREIGRGVDHIDNIPGLMIKPLDNEDLDYEIESLEKQILVKYNDGLNRSNRTAIFQVTIDNNINVNGNVITTSMLIADYKIKVDQTGTIWKIYNSPDYINEDGIGIFLLGHKEGSQRGFIILTNKTSEYSINPVIPSEAQSIFKVVNFSYGTKIIDGERWNFIGYYIETLSDNTEDSWRPKKTGTDDPCKIVFKTLIGDEEVISLYAIQLKEIQNPIEVWEETIIPGQYTRVNDNILSEDQNIRGITLLNTTTKNFIVVKNGGEGVESLNWYYYDLMGSNQFYLTDSNFQITNVGTEYIVSPETTLLDLGTGEERSRYGRLINVNRSDIIGSIGTLVVTESSAYPRTWRDLIDNNTANVEVNRELDNIYIQVGENEEDLKNEDYSVNIDKIGVFSLEVISNFKYIIQTYGYLKIYPDSDFSRESGYELPTRLEVFNSYNYKSRYTFALIEFDEDPEMEESYIEIRSGGLIRKITLNKLDPEKTHDYLLNYPEEDGVEVKKPNIIRVFNNGALSPEEIFLYRSSTTPKIDVGGINKVQGVTDPMFYNQDDEYYGYHQSKVSISVPNSKALQYTKYPMKSFGYVREMSQDYSDSEIETSTNANTYLEYPLYMKGKEHFLWCVESLGGFSNLQDPTLPSPPALPIVYEKKYMIIDANGESGKTVYVVSRYSVDNRTFITEVPEETEYKIKRDELEVNIKILPQQTIALDKRSQIEYAIPIQVSCNVENNGGNIYLGSVTYKAKTEITEDSIEDVIEVSNNIIGLEGIDKDYISNYITSFKIQEFSIMIFQLGTDKSIFDLYSSIPDLGIRATTNYIIPEIGNDYTITDLTVTKSVSGNGNDIVTVSSEWDPKYFLIRVDSDERVVDIGDRIHYHWYGSEELPTGLINNNEYLLDINASLKDGSSKQFQVNFKKYGCNYGLYVEGNAGFGYIDDEYDYLYNKERNWDLKYIEVSNEGGSIFIHAGIFYAVNGIESTEALMVPAEYEFIGENQPLESSWTNGNLDDDGNLKVVLPPRTRDEDGDKRYILKVTQPHEYYPLKLYIIFFQRSLHGSAPDTDKEKYKLMFLDDEINILSNGEIVGNKEGKIRFVHNLPLSEFNRLSFGWTQKDPNTPLPVSPDDLKLEEVERSFEEGYVKFKFKPNGSRIFIDAYIKAYYRVRGDYKIEIGRLSAIQGYFCLITKFYNPFIYTKSQGMTDFTPLENWTSRISPASGWLYSFRQGGREITSSRSITPCKSNDDNANSSNFYGRSIYQLFIYKKEYFDSVERILNIMDVFNSVEVLYISPETILESYDLSFVESSETSDRDAKVNIRFSGLGYATSQFFNEYNPYIELNYSIKDEYIRSDHIISATGKITIKHPDTGELIDFYLLITQNIYGSDEPQDISLLKFSSDSISFDYREETRQISFSPASFGGMFTITKMKGSDWITTDLISGSNFISVVAKENKTTNEVAASYRTGQLKIDVKDKRDEYILGTYYINVDQVPQNVPIELSDYNIKFGYEGGAKQVTINPKPLGSKFNYSVMSGSDWITVTSGENFIDIDVSENKTTTSAKAYFRTAQIKVDVMNPKDEYIVKSFSINVEQEADIQYNKLITD